MLKIVLKPNEKIIVGNAVLTGSTSGKTEITVHNDVPILREKDVMTLENADTACKHIYLLVQMMYLEPTNSEQLQSELLKLIDDVRSAAPSTIPYLVEIQQHLVSGAYYKAMRECQKLIAYEGGLINA